MSRPVYLGGLGFGFKWNMGWMHDTLTYFQKDPVYRRFHHHTLTFSLMYAFSENFILPLSHDEVVHGKKSLLDKMPGDRWQKFANLRSLYTYMWAHPGKKLLFMGGELASGGSGTTSGSLHWNLLEYAEHQGVQSLVRDLNRIYRGAGALRARLRSGGFRWLEANDTANNVLAFARLDAAARSRRLRDEPLARSALRVPRRDAACCRWKELLNTRLAPTTAAPASGIWAASRPSRYPGTTAVLRAADAPATWSGLARPGVASRSMRKAAIIGWVVSLVATGCSILAASGAAASTPSLEAALDRTAKTPSERFAFTVRISNKTLPVALRVQGQQSGETISVRLKLSGAKKADGTPSAAADGATLLLGPFLYERAPSGAVISGKVRWVRLHVADLSPGSTRLKAVHDLTPRPLLRVLGEARMTQTAPGARLYRGTVAYDNPIVRSSLARLTGGTDFRGLRLSAYVGRDGLVHRLRLTGRTADRHSTLSLSAKLFAFGRPVHVKPPPRGRSWTSSSASSPRSPGSELLLSPERDEPAGAADVARHQLAGGRRVSALQRREHSCMLLHVVAQERCALASTMRLRSRGKLR